MEFLFGIISILCFTVAMVLKHLEYKRALDYKQVQDEYHFERELKQIYRERCLTTQFIVMETYKRIYAAPDNYIHKREILLNLIDLLNIQHVGSCKDALEKAYTPPEDEDEDESDDCE